MNPHSEDYCDGYDAAIADRNRELNQLLDSLGVDGGGTIEYHITTLARFADRLANRIEEIDL